MIDQSDDHLLSIVLKKMFLGAQGNQQSKDI